MLTERCYCEQNLIIRIGVSASKAVTATVTTRASTVTWPTALHPPVATNARRSSRRPVAAMTAEGRISWMTSAIPHPAATTPVRT